MGPSGNLAIRGQQFWLGPARVGQVVTFWIDCDMVHLSIGGTRVKTVRSHLSVNDLAILVAHGAVPAGPPPLPSTLEPDGVVELERAVSRFGSINLAGRKVLIAEILGGRQVGIRIEGQTLMAFDLDTRELLRTRPYRSCSSSCEACVGSARPGRRYGPRPSRSLCNGGPRPKE